MFLLKKKKQDNNTQANTLIAASGCALLAPLIPIIDGDCFKGTYKNKNITKYTTGMAALGGFLIISKILSDKYIKKSQTPEEDKMIRNTVLGACSVPLFMLIENWANIDKKTFKKMVCTWSLYWQFGRIKYI